MGRMGAPVAGSRVSTSRRKMENGLFARVLVTIASSRRSILWLALGECNTIQRQKRGHLSCLSLQPAQRASPQSPRIIGPDWALLAEVQHARVTPSRWHKPQRVPDAHAQTPPTHDADGCSLADRRAVDETWLGSFCSEARQRQDEMGWLQKNNGQSKGPVVCAQSPPTMAAAPGDAVVLLAS
ncbi:hypothetical protein BGZ61DRAFT_515212 [Ilyonectria robusta]|uniref:uncharacterized protein n=1 Tax=Ilyonectria robusta TaxID=1079257 RepID=UPI001E8D8966|nr:uncharacterized protein BGZ61DRAFT_515212 [Ilyonectria robusta]KAH8734025.1 hypothetical protein BGZ61DRAFT_515212 [Ilyonectria robusta]